MRKRKAETVLSDTVGYYHRSKLCCLGICKVDYIGNLPMTSLNLYFRMESEEKEEKTLTPEVASVAINKVRVLVSVYTVIIQGPSILSFLLCNQFQTPTSNSKLFFSPVYQVQERK